MEIFRVALSQFEIETLIKINDREFPFFQFLDDESKVKSAIEYLVEREVAVNGYEG